MFECLHLNGKLSYLNLAGNYISDETAVIIAQYLKEPQI